MRLFLAWTLGASSPKQISSGSIRKILVSVKFVTAILGPEMGAPILWTRGQNALFLQEKPMSVKFLVWGGGGGTLGFGGGECRFYFYGRADFSGSNKSHERSCHQPARNSSKRIPRSSLAMMRSASLAVSRSTPTATCITCSDLGCRDDTTQTYELETGIGGGGSNLQKLEGGGWKFKFPGAPEIDPFLQRFYRKSSIWGSKEAFEGQLSGRVPPL